ncbi:MAG: TolC family protein [Saprospiraceae bacterium]
MSKLQLFILIMFGAFGMNAQKTLTLEEAIQYAMKNNISIRNAQINIADAEERIAENKATGLPQVNASLDWQSFFLIPKIVFPASFTNGTSNAVFGILGGYGVKDRNGVEIPSTPPIDPNASTEPVKVAIQQRHAITPSLSVSQLFYSGSYNVAKRAAREYRDLVQKQLSSKQNEIRNQVIDAYLPALLITESVKTLDKNIANLEKLLRETSALNQQGFIESLDVDRLTLSLENIKTQKANIERNKELVINALKFVMGAGPGENFELTDNVVTLLTEVAATDLEGTVDFNKRPEYILIKQGEKMQSLQLDLAKSSVLPTVAGFASYSNGFQGNSFKANNYFFIPTGVVGAKVTVPIWNGGGTAHTKQRAVLALEQVRNQRIEFENAVNLQVSNSRIAYNNAKINLASQEKNLNLAEKIFNISKTKYKEGVGSSVEIIQAESTLYQNQQNVIQAKYDLLKAKMELDKALGNR